MIDLITENIVVIGQSCGVGLAVGALLQAIDKGLPMPACLVSLTGRFDLSITTMPHGRDPFLTPGWFRK
jgi:acetyl esterase/lipase